MQLCLSDTVTHSDHLLQAAVGEDIVLMNPDAGRCFGLDDIASRLWTETERPVSVSSVCDRLAGAYDAPIERIRVDVLTLCQTLLDNGLLTLVA